MIFEQTHTQFTLVPTDAFVLQAAIVEGGDGDYLEVGVRTGTSLCFAGLIKRLLGQTGLLYGIERSDGFRPTIEANLASRGLSATVFYKMSSPWPAGSITPAVAYIDGGHEFEYCSLDWKNLSAITKRFIVCHDYPAELGVKQMVEEIALHDPAWRQVTHVRRTVVFERCAAS